MNKYCTFLILQYANRILLVFGGLFLSSQSWATVEAHFIPNTTEGRPNDIIYFNNTSTDADTYAWQLDGVLQSTDENFDYTFITEGVFEVSLIAADVICQDTFTVLITISETVFAKVGMPVWPGSSFQDDKITIFDWRKIPFMESVIPNTDFVGKSKVSAGFNNCGALAFVVFHKGSYEPNSLVIFDAFGNELLTENTNNGGGLNAIHGTGELQVVKVPSFSDEWYIIYSGWSVNDGTYDSVYRPASILYARVRLLPTGIMEVLERDQVLTDNNGVANKYLDGKAVSRTANGNLNEHFLYAARHDIEETFISVDRFLIDSNGITYQANTGNVPCEWWGLSISQSPIELSPREDIVAVCLRNQTTNSGDVFLFDAADFSNTNYREINADQLILVADGEPNDMTNLLPNSGVISEIANDPNFNLSFLNNFGRKFTGIEFSPNGRFLYLMGGGFPGVVSVTYLSYLAQIDLASSPLEVRIQIQTVPNNDYTDQGAGCVSSECSSPWRNLNGLETGFDGNLYFHKRGAESNNSALQVVPDPNNFMPQNLSPSEIDLASSEEPNIPSELISWGSPDQIDGFNYLDLGFREVEVIVTKLNCANQCMEPYVVDVKTQGELITSFKVESCPDTFYLCADTTLVYELIDPITDLTFDNAISLGEPNYLPNTTLFDFSENESVMLEELAETIFICEGASTIIFGEEISSEGFYYGAPSNATGCDTLDAIRLQFYEDPDIALELTSIPCDSADVGSIIPNINGVGPYQYQWNYNNMNTAELVDVPAGIYSLEVIDGNGCSNSSSIEMLSPLSVPELNFEIQNVPCYGEENGALIIENADTFYEYSLDGNNYQDISVFNNLGAGSYVLHFATDECEYSQNFDITQPDESIVVLPDDVTINLGETYEIQSYTTIVNDPPIYNWDPIETLSCDNCEDPIATPLYTTLYALTMPDTNGCIAHDEILITVKKERNVFIPNVFSPNADGQNDKLIIFTDPSVKEVLRFRIFDRWGEFIYEDANFQPNDPTHGWDGYFKGEIMQPEVFTYYAEIEFVDGDVVLYKGDFTIIR